MKVVIAYVAVVNGPITYDYCARFSATYQQFPAGYEHKLVVACNGGMISRETAELFQFPVKFYPRVNDPGYDITAFMDVAQKFHCDCLVAMGESTWFHREGWLNRIVDCWNQFGPGMYGIFSSNLKRPHLNTTGFAVAPGLLRGSTRPQNKEERYEWEHGQKAFWRKLAAMGYPTRLVTWDGCWEPKDWRRAENLLWRGDQSNCLWHCIHSDRFAEAPDDTKERWARAADSVFV